jgi:hypothetical protein
MSDLPDLREQIAALFRSAPGETRLGDEPPGLIADAVLGVLPVAWDRFVRTIQVLRDQLVDATAEGERLRDGWRESDQFHAKAGVEHLQEIARLRREVAFEANGEDTFSGADAAVAQVPLFSRNPDSAQPALQDGPYPRDLYPGCPCYACDSQTWRVDPTWGTAFSQRMSLCPQCGNKRCPGAADHTNACSGSNEPGQAGSLYPSSVHPEGGGS